MLVSVENLSVHFPSARALTDVSLAFASGEVHGLIGENGAGKSTLMRVLSGLQKPTGGRLLIDKTPVEIAGPTAALARGIVMIHQELNLVDELSVADNIYLGREQTRGGLLRSRVMKKDAKAVLASLQSSIKPSTRVRNLPIAQQQMVEIAKAISQNARLLIMDEPTAVLSERETAALFALIDRLRKAGVGIVYISHRLPEVLRLCDRITVLRDGQVVSTLNSAEAKAASETQLAGLMVGRPMGDFFPPRDAAGATRTITGRLALAVRDLSVPGFVQEATFDLRAGEILGFAGLIGAGRTELCEAIAGLRRRSGGEIFVAGESPIIRTPADAVAAGIAYLPEDRKATGLVQSMSIRSNSTLASLEQFGKVWLRPRRETAAAKQQVQTLRIKVGRLGNPVSTLSGGNQQKVLLGKWLLTSPAVLIVDEPTRGVDVGAKRQIYEELRRLTAAGMACILVSSELNEVLGMSDRIAVMRAGKIIGILPAGEATEESVMQLAAGVSIKSVGTGKMGS